MAVIASQQPIGHHSTFQRRRRPRGVGTRSNGKTKVVSALPPMGPGATLGRGTDADEAKGGDGAPPARESSSSPSQWSDKRRRKMLHYGVEHSSARRLPGAGDGPDPARAAGAARARRRRMSVGRAHARRARRRRAAGEIEQRAITLRRWKVRGDRVLLVLLASHIVVISLVLDVLLNDNWMPEKSDAKTIIFEAIFFSSSSTSSCGS
ncbi:hypothetical protein SO694_0004304 [Aureococcus anophagefferens]|uniref:Uncharacterized protein n=1 Tax=Aureococcus anophagefferens TaxID=44056 RepID=A0ABR1G7I1_AURAN